MNQFFERLTQALRSRLQPFLFISAVVFFSLSGGGLYAMFVADGREGLAWLLLVGAIAWGALTAFVIYSGQDSE